MNAALDQIHSAAYQSDALTVFNDFAAPQAPTSGVDDKNLPGDIPGGLSGLYSRLKVSVGGVKDIVSGTAKPVDKTSAESSATKASSGESGAKAASDQAASATDSQQSHQDLPQEASSANSPRPGDTLSAHDTALSLASSKDSKLPSKAASISSKVSTLSSLSPLAASASNNEKDESLSPIPSARTSQPPVRSTGVPARPLDNAPHTGGSGAAGNQSPDKSRRLLSADRQAAWEMEPILTSASRKSSRNETGRDANVETQDDPTPRPLPPFHPDNSALSVPLTEANRAQARDEGSTFNERSETVPTSVPVSDATAKSSTAPFVTRPREGQGVRTSEPQSQGYPMSRASSTETAASSPRFGASVDFQIPNTLRPKKPATGGRSDGVLSQLRSKLLSKDFWMRDENAKDCFLCGDAFSTFRRKHHCRTCGQIFDSKCTVLIPGDRFGQVGSIRVCKPCEAEINAHEDDSSELSDSEPSPIMVNPRVSELGVGNSNRGSNDEDDAASIISQPAEHVLKTPTMAIPAKRRAGEGRNRRSAVLEFNPDHPLTRPTSSKSLKSSMSGRAHSMGHKRHHTRQQYIRNFKAYHDDRAPFQRRNPEELGPKSRLSAFHKDNIIDPDLAQYLSDDASSGEEQAGLAGLASEGSLPKSGCDGERATFGGLLAAVKKGRSAFSDRNGANSTRDADEASISSSRAVNLPRSSRRRNRSVASSVRHSPRASKDNALNGHDNLGQGIALPTRGRPSAGFKMTRSSSMKGEGAPPVELNVASLQHVRSLLRQLLKDSGVRNIQGWEIALMPVLLKATDEVVPDVQRGDDMDIRHYVKLKKIPGGRPGDTCYVSGLVFTKNLALKSMRRSIPYPNILIITFPLEYARHQNHFMSLEPVIRQEREFLENLVSRIAELGPSLLLVEKNVSGLALELLEKANIATAYNVKPSVLEAVSRCTQTRIITSMDQLVTMPVRSTCASFDVRTYVHNNRKKTYMYLSGCPKDLGCTIVLRGGSRDMLMNIKRITEFLVYVVYNLKLETCLMRDEFAQIPTSPDNKASTEDGQDSNCAKGDSNGAGNLASQRNANGNSGNGVSAGGLSNMASGGDEVPDDVPMPAYYEDMVEKLETTILSASPFVKFEPPYLLMRARELDRRLTYLKRLRDQDFNADRQPPDEKARAQKFTLVTPEMVHRSPRGAPPKVKEVLHAAHDAEYERMLHNYQTQKRQWEAYIFGNGNLFDPYAHQNIVILFSLVCTTSSIPCSGPDIFALEFYNEHGGDTTFDPDCTVGQYVEDLCHSANAVCTSNGCEKQMVEHHRQYVHGEAQLSVFIQPYPCKLRGLQNVILMWSCCKICGNETQVLPMSEDTWKYSFGKYLELSFWGRNLHARAGVCPHDLQRDHLRYFGFKDVALRIHYDKINLLEIVVPRSRVTWKVDNDLKLRNGVYTGIEQRLNKFMASVNMRLKSINVESVVPEFREDCKKEIDRLLKKASDDIASLIKQLQEKYMNSHYWEVIPLNEVLRSVQEKVVEWDAAFTEFETNFFPSEKDIKRLATLQLRRIFLDKDTSVTSLETSDGQPVTPTEVDHDEDKEDAAEATDRRRMARRMTLSPEKAKDVLVSVVEEHSGKKNREKPELALQPPEQSPSATPGEPLSPRQTVGDGEEKAQGQAVEERAPPEKARDSTRGQEQVGDVAVSSSPTAEAPLIPPMEDRGRAAGAPESEATATKTAKASAENVEGGRKSVKSRSRAETTEDNSRAASRSLPPSAIPRLAEHAFRRSGPKSPTYRSQSQQGYFQRERDVSCPPPPSEGTATNDQRGKFPDRKLSERIAGPLKSSRLVSVSGQSLIPQSVSNKRSSSRSRVFSLAKHFEQLSREFEKERQRERRQRAARGSYYRAYPIASSKPIVEVYKNVAEAVEEPENATATHEQPIREGEEGKGPSEGEIAKKAAAVAAKPETTERAEAEEAAAGSGKSEHEAELHSDEDRASAEDLQITESQEEGKMPLDEEAMDLKDLPKHERNTLLKMLTNFWSERSASGWAPLEYPLNMGDHVFTDCDIIVREDEPSSLIAFALDSGDYKEKLASIEKHYGESDMSDSNLEEDEDPEVARESRVEHALLRVTGTHLKYQFEEGQARMLCKVFYAEQFDALRKKCGVANRIVESLSRCAKFDSQGGKTKSLFLKTLDDRFILKSLSHIETQAFLKFAPAYFQIMSEALFHELPSAIAKMFGFYQVIIKNPATGVEFNYFLLLMENLFYDRVPTRIFDLKGSMRNRKVQSTGQRNEVLLDENMVDFIYETPLFTREHSKRLLSQSVWNDTLFLGRQDVMDYSLMIAIDESRQELVVGIIDCIRTYTWDKKLESWIKDRGLAGGSKNRPTVTSPKEYKSRFREAMARYVLQAPR